MSIQKNKGYQFISYPSSEKDFVSQLSDDLQKGGISVWRDKEKIYGGADWRISIQQAILRCTGLIVVFCPAYIKSDYCMKELYYAASLKRPIFPLLLHDVDKKDWPLDIQGHHYIDFRRYNEIDEYNRSLQEIVQAIYLYNKDIRDQYDPLADLEQRYLEGLIREFEGNKGILEYVELSGKANISREYHPAYPEEFRHLHQNIFWIKENLRRVGNEVTSENSEKELLPHIDHAVSRFASFVLVGEPGSGKTTMLRHLAHRAAWKRLEAPQEAPVPLFLELPKWDTAWTLETFIRRKWDLGDNPTQLLAQGKIILYLDGLNEMGVSGPEKIRRFLRPWLDRRSPLLRVIITCRKRDYIDAFDLGLPIIALEEMNSQQINQFVKNYLKDKAEPFLKQLQPEHTLVPNETYSMLDLARNPYLLSALIYVYERDQNSVLPRNYGALFRKLAYALWAREKKNNKNADSWKPFKHMESLLSRLAFAMIDEGKPIDVPVSYARKYVRSQELLLIGHNANLLRLDEDQEQVRFYHQLMLEYFAGVRLGEVGLQKKLERREFDYDWDLSRNFQKWGQAVIAYCGILENADAALDQLLTIDVFLAAHCIDTGIYFSDKARRNTAQRLIYGLRSLTVSIEKSDFSSSMQQRVFLYALSKTGDPLAAEELASYLTHHLDYMVRDTAAIGLLKMNPRLAVPLLKKTLDALEEGQEDWVYCETICTLAAIQNPSIVPIIISLLVSPDYQKSQYAAFCLPALEEASFFVEGLQLALKDAESLVRKYAAKKLQEIK